MNHGLILRTSLEEVNSSQNDSDQSKTHDFLKLVPDRGVSMFRKTQTEREPCEGSSFYTRHPDN